MKNLYVLNEAEADAFVEYWYINGESQDIISLHPDLKSMFFCEGANVQTLAEYTYTEHSPTTEVPYLEMLIPALTEEQFGLWFSAGSQVPSTEYVTYPCTKIADESAQMNMSTAEVVTVNLSGVWKQNHRYRVKASGTFTDSDNANIVKDAFWSVDTSTGIKTFEGANVISTGGVVALNSAQVPYQPSHIYNVIVEKTSGNSAGQLTRNNNPFNLPNTTGILNFEISDEGQFTG